MMATPRRSTGHRKAVLLAITAGLAAACRLVTPTAQPAGTDALTPAPFPSPTSFAPLPADSPTAPAAPPTPLTGQPTGFFDLVVPNGWYHALVEDGEITALVFTPLDPAALAAFDDPEWMVPPDFTIAALARSPLPAGADPEALTAGMEQSLESFSETDLHSLLSGAGRIGLIDLEALENITLIKAERGELGGRPSIAVRGAADFGPGRPPALEILVHLAWTADSFFTFYWIAGEAAWESHQLPLNRSLDSIELP